MPYFITADLLLQPLHMASQAIHNPFIIVKNWPDKTSSQNNIFIL